MGSAQSGTSYPQHDLSVKSVCERVDRWASLLLWDLLFTLNFLSVVFTPFWNQMMAESPRENEEEGTEEGQKEAPGDRGRPTGRWSRKIRDGDSKNSPSWLIL